MPQLEDRVLTEEEQKKILDIVYANMAPDDRYPEEVCAEKYNSDYNAYCLAMMKWHSITI